MESIIFGTKVSGIKEKTGFEFYYERTNRIKLCWFYPVSSFTGLIFQEEEVYSISEVTCLLRSSWEGLTIR